MSELDLEVFNTVIVLLTVVKKGRQMMIVY